MYIVKTPDFEFRDERGSLVQLVHDGYKQINILRSKKGTFRGGHYHKESKEAFYVINGSVRVEFRTQDGNLENHVFTAGEFFEIQPYIIHSMSFDEDCDLVAMYDICVEKEDGTKDIFSE